MCRFSKIELCLQNNFPTVMKIYYQMTWYTANYIHGNISPHKRSTNKTETSEHNNLYEVENIQARYMLQV